MPGSCLQKRYILNLILPLVISDVIVNETFHFSRSFLCKCTSPKNSITNKISNDVMCWSMFGYFTTHIYHNISLKHWHWKLCARTVMSYNTAKYCTINIIFWSKGQDGRIGQGSYSSAGRGSGINRSSNQSIEQIRAERTYQRIGHQQQQQSSSNINSNRRW